MNIFTTSEQKQSKHNTNLLYLLFTLVIKKKPIIVNKKNLFSQTRKWDICKITQENQHLLKRLNDRQSFYDTNKWEKDYEKSQEYKKNICVFPSIKFETPTRDVSSYSNSKQDFKKNTLYNKLKFTNFNFTSTLSSTKDMFSSNSFELKQKTSDKKILFSKSVFLGDLFHCMVNFYVENKK